MYPLLDGLEYFTTHKLCIIFIHIATIKVMFGFICQSVCFVITPELMNTSHRILYMDRGWPKEVMEFGETDRQANLKHKLFVEVIRNWVKLQDRDT